MEYKHIAAVDPEIARAIASERDRQETHLELIASENSDSFDSIIYYSINLKYTQL